jgi:outer membrane receptor protein involved in Fe transport
MWSVGMRWQHLPSVGPPSGSSTLPVEEYDLLDAFASISFNERYRLQAGIDNLLDNDPATVNATVANAARGSTNSNYDGFGRRVYLGLSVQF